jgi:hypothetical protein
LNEFGSFVPSAPVPLPKPSGAVPRFQDTVAVRQLFGGWAVPR